MRDNRRFAVIVTCFLIGFVFAFILQLLSDQNIIIPDLLSDAITLRVLQFISILMWTLIGVVLGAMG